MKFLTAFVLFLVAISATSIQAKTFHLMTARGGMTWENANVHCNSRGMQLASIRSAAENDEVDRLAGQSDSYWIGAHKEGSSFKWRDGGSLSYVHWDAEEPDGSGDCVSIINGRWNDASCASVKQFFCESH